MHPHYLPGVDPSWSYVFAEKRMERGLGRCEFEPVAGDISGFVRLKKCPLAGRCCGSCITTMRGTGELSVFNTHLLL
jgi:hypothetical protein